MRVLILLTAAVCAPCLNGCAVLGSPMSWEGSSDREGKLNSSLAPKASVPTLSPGELQIGPELKTFEQRTTEVRDYATLSSLIADTKAAVSKHKSNIRLQLDYASGGNYGLGILGAGAALFGAPTDFLKGVGLLGGTHLALSNRLSPKEQLTILADIINRLECVDSIARVQAPAMDLAAQAVLQDPKNLKPTNQAILDYAIRKRLVELGKPDSILAASEFPNKVDYLAALRNILYAANAKMDGVFLNALANTHVGSDIVASVNTIGAALQLNAQTAIQSKANPAGANALKNGEDLSATIPVKLTACQPS